MTKATNKAALWIIFAILIALSCVALSANGGYTSASASSSLNDEIPEFNIIENNDPAFQEGWESSSHIPLELSGASYGQFWHIDKPEEKRNHDFVIINGISLKDWEADEDSKFGRLSFMKGRNEVRVIDLAVSDGKESNAPLASKNIKSIEFKAGFRLYGQQTGDGVLEPVDWANFVPLAELKRNVVLVKASTDVNAAWRFLIKQDASNIDWATEGDSVAASDAISLECEPNKRIYALGDTFAPKGMQIKVFYQNDDVARTVNVTQDMVSGFDSTTAGEKSVTITYKGATLNYKVTVDNVSTVLNANLPEFNIIENSDPAFQEGWVSSSQIPLEISGASYGQFWCIDLPEEKRNRDFVFINGISLKDLAEDPNSKFDRLSYMKGRNDIRVIDLAVSDGGESNAPLASKNIKSIEFKAGFRLYGTKTGDNVGNNNVAAYEPLFELKNTIVLVKASTEANPVWSFLLKQDAGNTDWAKSGEFVSASDSVSIVAPPAKTTYFIGETFDYSGMKLNVRYQNDDNMYTVHVDSSMISGFDSSTVGSKKVTVTYRGVSVEQAINVISNEMFEVTFHTNSGSSIEKMQVASDELLTAPTTTRDYYNFIGWFNNAELQGEMWNFDVDTVTANLNLYASWQAKIFSISYVLDGGLNSSENPATYTIESGIITLNAPTKEGYNFIGWYTEKDFTNKVISIDDSEIKDITLYAKFEAIVATGKGCSSIAMTNIPPSGGIIIAVILLAIALTVTKRIRAK